MEKDRTRRILEVIEQEVGHFSPAATFEEIGLDSLEVLDLIQKVESACQIRISDEDILKLNTIGDVAHVADRG